jgi:hypothetical protein
LGGLYFVCFVFLQMLFICPQFNEMEVMANLDEKEELINQVKVSFVKKQLYNLKELAERASEIALVDKDDKMIKLAIVSYAFSQMIEKGHFINSSDWSIFSDKMIEKISNVDDEKIMQEVLSEIWEFSEKNGRFVTNVVEKARLKVGTQLYAHGASLGVAAFMAKIDRNELLSYISVTHLNEKYITLSVGERLKRVLRNLEQ